MSNDVEVLTGGVLSMSVGGKPQQQTPREDAPVGIRADVMPGSVRPDGSGAVIIDQVNNEPDPSATNVMDTLRGPGGKVNPTITTDCTILVGGEKLSVGAALSLGWVRRCANGLEYTGKGAAQIAAIRAQEQAHYQAEVTGRPTQAPERKQMPTGANLTIR